MLFTNKRIFPIITPYGKKLGSRTIRNAPFNLFFPNDELAFVKWILPDEKKPIARNEDITNSRFVVENPIIWNGKEMFGYYQHGSLVKQGETIASVRDYGVEYNIYRYVQDSQRFGAWMMAQSWYGLSHKKRKIMLVPPGTKTKWGLVEDGFGYFNRDLLELNTNKTITLGGSRGSYSFWQRIPWTEELAAELTPLIMERLPKINGIQMLEDMHNSAKYKKQLVDLCPEMEEHPYVALSIARMWVEYLARVATTVPDSAIYRIAIPSECETVEVGEPNEKIVVARYPIDSFGSLQAVEPVYNPNIADKEIIQYRLSSVDYFAKGCGELVSNMPYDAVICTEDLKMAEKGVPSVCLDGEIDCDAAIAVTQRFSPGCAIGVNANWAKDRMGLDFDGDLIEKHDCTVLPELFNAVKNLPFGISPKLPKKKALLSHGDTRPEFIIQNMMNLVGFASNVTSDTLGKKDQEQVAIDLGYPTAEILHGKLNYAIKVGTDMFKCDIDPTPVVAFLNIIQGRLSMEGNLAPWTSWDGVNGAFKRFIPGIYEEVYSDTKGYHAITLKGEVIDLEENEALNSIWSIHDGTISQIARLTLPFMSNLLNLTIKTKPLSYYRPWAELESDNIKDDMKQIRAYWNTRYPLCNFSVPDDVRNLIQELQAEVQHFLDKDEYTKFQAANALWELACSAKGEDNAAAVVFYAFPDECLEIVSHKPGYTGNMTTIINGIDYQVPGFQSGVIDGEIVEVVINKNGRLLSRKALCGIVSDSQKQPQMPYPKNMLGLIAVNANQPQDGKYTVSITKNSDKSWLATFYKLGDYPIG